MVLWVFPRREKEVAIGMEKDVSFALENRKVYPEGWLLFLKGIPQGSECTLANTYYPKKKKHYMKEIMIELMEFKKSNIILVRDFNCLVH